VEGQLSSSQTVATFTDPGGAEALGDYSAMIDWGDGSVAAPGTITFAAGVFTVSGTHTYSEESAPDHAGSNPYVIAVTISHETSADVVVNSTATVSDPAVVATGAFAVTAVEGQLSSSQTVATFTDPGGPEAIGDYSALIDWGDATSSAGTITFSAGTFTVKGAHNYDEEGNYVVTVTLSHESAPDAVALSSATVADAAVRITTL